LHPHIHALVTDGGLANHEWRSPRRSHFLPARVVKALFRGKLLAALSHHLASGELQLPPDCSTEHAISLINRLGRIKWHVWLCQRYAHGHGVLVYLARYLRGGPLRDSQLVSVSDHHIVTRYHAHNAPASTLALAPDAWLRRYLEHAPITGQHSLRRYGIYAPAAQTQRLRARELVPPTSTPEPRHAATYSRTILRCPHCTQPLHFVQRLPPQRAPP
jgi:hypothetical protein